MSSRSSFNNVFRFCEQFGASCRLIVKSKSLLVTCSWNCSQVALGCSIEYCLTLFLSWFGVNPLTANLMYFCLFWAFNAALAALSAFSSHGHPLSTACFTRWKKFYMISSFPLREMKQLCLPFFFFLLFASLVAPVCKTSLRV